MTSGHRPGGRLPKRVQKIYRAIAEGAPEMLTDADFVMRTPRAKPQLREKKEVQQPLVVYLRKHLPAGSIVHAQAIQPLNENHRFAMIRDGVQFGMPDLLVIVPGDERNEWPVLPRFFFIECKHPDGGVISGAQEATQRMLIDAGCEVLSECRSVQQAISWLTERGVKFTNR